MVTADENRPLWHRGTKIGIVYAIIALVIVGLTTTQDPTGSLAWLERFAVFVALLPLAAASQAYVAGKNDARSMIDGRDETKTVSHSQTIPEPHTPIMPNPACAAPPCTAGQRWHAHWF